MMTRRHEDLINATLYFLRRNSQSRIEIVTTWYGAIVMAGYFRREHRDLLPRITWRSEPVLEEFNTEAIVYQ